LSENPTVDSEKIASVTLVPARRFQARLLNTPGRLMRRFTTSRMACWSGLPNT
jgi:hypothetical protein